jgi:glucosamine--fructose-6-phosphate aminotransferase (isomerizing)
MLGEHTYQEIMSQPDAWLTALDTINTYLADEPIPRLHNFDEVIITGCGSTYYLALAGAALLRETLGVAARGLPASELWLSPKTAYTKGKTTLLIAVSRSGTTTETLRAVESFKQQQRGQVMTLCCYPDSTLAQLGHSNMVLPSGQEQSMAQTRAFTVLYLAVLALCHHGSQQPINGLKQLAPILQGLFDTYQPLMKQLGQNLALERFYFLGAGARYGLACELSLKMKEMTLSHSEPFHCLEFRHGPQAMVNEQTLIIGLVSQDNEVRERAVLNDMCARGATVLSLAETAKHQSQADVTDTTPGSMIEIAFNSKLEPNLRNILYLPLLQLMACERARAKNLNPDTPHNLTAVVVLDD